jgi:RimJ/RimL family protein N-acetyltransferase
MKPTIQLRDVEPNDVPLFFEHQRNPIAVAMVAFHSRDRAAFDQHWAKLLADDSCLKQTIVVSAVSAENPVVSAVSAEDQVVGNIGSWTSDGKRELGYWIDRAFWGRGIATERALRFPQSGTDPSALRRRGEAQRRFDPRPAKMRVHNNLCREGIR